MDKKIAQPGQVKQKFSERHPMIAWLFAGIGLIMTVVGFLSDGFGLLDRLTREQPEFTNAEITVSAPTEDATSVVQPSMFGSSGDSTKPTAFSPEIIVMTTLNPPITEFNAQASAVASTKATTSTRVATTTKPTTEATAQKATIAISTTTRPTTTKTTTTTTTTTTTQGILNALASTLSTTTTKPIIYTVSYNANGGSNPPPSQSVPNGTTITLPSLSNMTAPRYTISFNVNGGTGESSKTVSPAPFVWRLNSAEGTAYTAGKEYTVTSDATFYVTWLFASVGTFPADPTRASYKFDGWYTAANGGTKVTTSTIVVANVTYYAQWIQDTVQTYTVS